MLHLITTMACSRNSLSERNPSHLPYVPFLFSFVTLFIVSPGWMSRSQCVIEVSCQDEEM